MIRPVNFNHSVRFSMHDISFICNNFSVGIPQRMDMENGYTT